jgi:hypothetical protein
MSSVEPAGDLVPPSDLQQLTSACLLWSPITLQRIRRTAVHSMLDVQRERHAHEAISTSLQEPKAAKSITDI